MSCVKSRSKSQSTTLGITRLFLMHTVQIGIWVSAVLVLQDVTSSMQGATSEPQRKNRGFQKRLEAAFQIKARLMP